MTKIKTKGIYLYATWMRNPELLGDWSFHVIGNIIQTLTTKLQPIFVKEIRIRKKYKRYVKFVEDDKFIDKPSPKTENTKAK